MSMFVRAVGAAASPFSEVREAARERILVRTAGVACGVCVITTAGLLAMSGSLA
ncbi:hypothetical protein [Leifsonia poae]|uniref:Uncharacterized protein n=1 Tax=Leifsonia poae TaxID=110933 RepID=A0A9W6M017_9MICO|nr:hypothetical protein [Leifsonia poae]GLJ76455.1 hypothetical protein GCM10017584_20290 [Leifsonia poae]